VAANRALNGNETIGAAFSNQRPVVRRGCRFRYSSDLMKMRIRMHVPAADAVLRCSFRKKINEMLVRAGEPEKNLP